MTATITTVSTTTDQRTARQVAAGLRSLGLDATAKEAVANIPDVWAVEITYPEGRTMEGYLACLEILENIVNDTAARLA